MSEAQAAKMQAGCEAVMAALSGHGFDDDISTTMAVLGAVVGCFAAASEQPSIALDECMRVAASIVSGELLNPGPTT